MNTTAAVQKPIPIPDEQTRPFFEAAAREELVLQRCSACAAYMWPGHSRCTACFSGDLSWVAASGEATLYSYTLVHRTYDLSFADDVPYNVALVDLLEGVRVHSNIVEVDDRELMIGMRLEVVFDRLTDEIAIPKFRPKKPHGP